MLRPPEKVYRPQWVKPSLSMPRAKVVKLNSSFYVNVPAEEARRLGLREGQLVEVDVRPLGGTVADLAELRGKYKGKLPKLDRRRLWGKDWGGA